MSNFGPYRENKRAALGLFGATGSGFMAPKGARAYDTNMSEVDTLCGTVLYANKIIWDDGDSLRGSKRQERDQFDTFLPFLGLGYPM